MAATPVPPVPTPAPEPAPLSQGARLINTFVAPSKTFTDLRRNASWWAPFLLLAIVSAAFAYAVDAKVGFGKVVENQIDLSPKISQQMEQMPPEQREKNIHARAIGMRYSMYAFPVITLIIYLIIAAIYLGSYRFGAGVDLTFKVALAVVVYAALPEIIRGLLAVMSLLAGANLDSFNIQNPVATNLGYFLDPAGSHFWYSVATSLDIFRIWSLALTAIGFTCVTKVKRGTSFAIVLGWYVFLTLIFSGLGAMAS